MAKSIFNNINQTDIEKIVKKCSKYKYVSFDVFDTLIKRNVSAPKNIFDIVENKAAKEYAIKDFKYTRINQEKKLRQLKPFVTIDEIYDDISEIIGKKQAKELKDYEIFIEKKYCQKNYEVYQIYKKLKSMGKKIIAISDMYLNSKIISEILENAGIVVDTLYVSCDCKCKKNNGKLYKHVLKSEKINSKDIIHIGDNFKSDYLMAKVNGINAIHFVYKDFFNIKRYKNKIVDRYKYNNYFSVINNNVIDINNYYSKFGFSILGPLVYNYCYWLKEMCKKKEIERIYFFSRDGYLIKKIFDKLFQNEFETKYIYFSRRSIRVPFTFIDSSYETNIKFFPKTKLINLKVFLENFGLNSNNYINLIEKYGYSLDDNIYYDELLSNNKIREIYNEVYEDIKKESKKEYNLFKEYLKQEDFNGKIAVVDIGWHNSMQYYLEQISKRENMNLEMFGFYVGRQTGEKKVENVWSYIREDNETEYVDSVASFIGLIESVFLASEGSTKKYIKSKDRIKPVLLDYEYKEDDIENKAFEEIKAGVEKFINIVIELPGFNIYTLNGFDAYLPLRTFGTDPYLEDIKYFSEFRYLSEELVYFSNPNNFFYYLFHRKEFVRDIYNARWKIGFMKELIKIRLPYYKIYKKLR